MRPHPVSLIEEPEAHLHPQAQFGLPDLLRRIRGQVLVTTHSSHLVTVVEPRCIRLLRESPDGRINVVDLQPTSSTAVDRARRPELYVQEMEKLRRMVERPFGELLFASVVVLGDGATERALIPSLARHCLGSAAHGLCVVDPGSMGSGMATAVVKFANLVGVPWLLFADADVEGRRSAERLVRDHGDNDSSHIIWVSDGKDTDRKAATERMFIKERIEISMAACEQLGYQGDRSEEMLLSFMKKHKGAIGGLLAAELIERYPWSAHERMWPKPLAQLIRRLGSILEC